MLLKMLLRGDGEDSVEESERHADYDKVSIAIGEVCAAVASTNVQICWS